MTVRTSEELTLLLNYLSLIGIWFGIPSVTLFINKDNRWPFAALCLSLIVLLIFISYLLHWEVLFPKSAEEIKDNI